MEKEMKKQWVLKSEWMFHVEVQMPDERRVRVKMSNVDRRDLKLARSLARVIELWAQRGSEQAARP